MIKRSLSFYVISIFCAGLYGEALRASWSDFDAPSLGGNQPAVSVPVSPLAQDLSLQKQDITVDVMGEKLFNDLYDRLVGNKQGRSYQGALLKALRFYGTYTDEASFSHVETDIFANTPLWSNNFFSSFQGRCFNLAFLSESYPLSILNAACNSALQFVAGRTRQLDAHFYQSATASLFIPSNVMQNNETQTQQGQLARIDAAIAQFQLVMDSASAQLKVSDSGLRVEALKKNYQVIFDRYYTQRDQFIVRWFYSLIKDLAGKYNENTAQLKNYSFESIPDANVLLAYTKVFEKSLQRLSQAGGPVSVGTYSYTPESAQKSEVSDGTFTQPKDFVNSVLKDIYGSLATIGGFIGAAHLAKASVRALGKIVPPAGLQPIPLYGNYSDIPAYQTYSGKGIQSDAPMTAGNITVSPAFKTTQELFQVLTAWVEDVIRAYGFDSNNYVVWNKPKTSSMLTAVSSQKTDANPVRVQEQAVAHFVEAQKANAAALSSNNKSTVQQATAGPSSNASTESRDIFDALVKAGDGFGLAAQYYYAITNAAATQLYQSKQSAIQSVLTHFQRAVLAYQSAESAPLFALANADAKIQGDYYEQAQREFALSAEAFKSLSAPDLVNYTKKLSAQLGIMRYQSVLHGFVEYYKPYFGGYSDYAAQVPHLGDVNEQYKDVLATDYQDYLGDAFAGFEELLPLAVEQYREQLSFFFSLNVPDNKENQEAIAVLRSSIQVFDTLNKALSGIYRCALGDKGESVCAVAQQSLQSQNKCMVDGNTQECLGADNYIEAATEGSLADVIKWILFANDQYLSVQHYFEKVDELFSQYKTELSGYTSIQALLKSAEQKNLTFSQFFYLHQARLYASVGQKLYFGSSWSSTREGERKSSPLCVLLYGFSASLYERSGFQKQADAVRALAQDALVKNPEWPALFEKAAGYLLQKTTAQKTVQESRQVFEQALAYYQTAYRLGNRGVVGAYLKTLSSILVEGKGEGLAVQGFAEWIIKNPSCTEFPDLLKAVHLYEGYLICSVQKRPEAQAFYIAAQAALKDFYGTYDVMRVQVVFDGEKKISAEEFTKKERAFQGLLGAQRALASAERKMQSMASFFEVKNAVELSWKKEDSAVDGLMGNFYKKGADDLLIEQQEQFEKGTSLNSDIDSACDDIIKRYQRAAQYYAQAQDQDNHVKIQAAISNTLAFQTYSAVVPVIQFALSGVDLAQKVDRNTAQNSEQSVVRFSCLPIISFDKAVAAYTDDTPLYLLRLKKDVIPEKYLNTIAQYAGKKDSQTMLTLVDALAVPFYRETLSQQAVVYGKVSVEPYVTLYAQQVKRMLSKGVAVCGSTVKGTLTVEKTTVVTDKRNAIGKPITVDVYTLVQRNMPISALPRFIGEFNSAYQLYNDVPLKLYAQGNIPVAVGEYNCVPTGNQAGQQAINEAILNTYFAAAVPFGTTINKVMQTPLYKKAMQLSNGDRLNVKFDEYSDLYNSFQDSFENLLGLYGELSSFVETFGMGQATVNKLQADAYILWMNVNTALLCGDPSSNQFKEYFNVIANFSDQVKFFVSSSDTGYQSVSQAIQILAKTLGRAGDMLADQKKSPPSTEYPQTTKVYPVPVPLPSEGVGKAQSVYQYSNWEAAWTLYMIAIDQVKKALDENKDKDMKDLVVLNQELQKKSLRTVVSLATFYLSRFGYNAFTQCLVALKGDKKGTYPSKSADAKKAESQSDKNGKIFKNLISHQEYWDTVTINEVGKNPDYPAYLYPSIGDYPKILFTKDSAGNKIRTCDPQGSPYGVQPQDATSTVFQGVAVLETPAFQTLLKVGFADNAQSNFSSWESGSGNATENSNAGVAYQIMHDDLVRALFYLMNGIERAGNLFPPQKTDPKSASLSAEAITASEEIIRIFTRLPAFGKWFAPEGLPVISVQYRDDSAKKDDKDAKSVSRFAFMTDVVGQDGKITKILELSNPQSIYPHTLKYWASQPVFAADIANPLMVWIDAQQFSMLQTWLNQLHLVARLFYWHTYLPGTDYQDAQSQITSQVEQLGQKHYVDADNYIG